MLEAARIKADQEKIVCCFVDAQSQVWVFNQFTRSLLAFGCFRDKTESGDVRRDIEVIVGGEENHRITDCEWHARNDIVFSSIRCSCQTLYFAGGSEEEARNYHHNVLDSFAIHFCSQQDCQTLYCQTFKNAENISGCDIDALLRFRWNFYWRNQGGCWGEAAAHHNRQCATK